MISSVFTLTFFFASTKSWGPTQQQQQQVFGVGEINSQDIWVPVLFRFGSASLFLQTECRRVMSTRATLTSSTAHDCPIRPGGRVPPCFLRSVDFISIIKKSLWPQWSRVCYVSNSDSFCWLKWVAKENWVFESFDPLNRTCSLTAFWLVLSCTTCEEFFEFALLDYLCFSLKNVFYFEICSPSAFLCSSVSLQQ